MKSTAIILAAGQGKRMHSKVQKQFLSLKGKPVLYYSLACFQNSPEIQEIILVTSGESVEYCRQEIVQNYGFSKVKKIIPGGKERYDSVFEGLMACGECDYVYIHDGARPFITEEILVRAEEAVKKYGACVVGMLSKDTVKIADENQMIAQTPKRSQVWTIQTPQVFSYDLIYKAYEKARQGSMEGITDDAMVAEAYGNRKIPLIEGSYENIKITTPEDLLIAERILENTELSGNIEGAEKRS